MFAKGKGPQSPSDAQAKEKLVQHVYEYLVHMGAQKSAQTFLAEMRWDKQYPINLGESPGFLFSWWCVFWDLYSAAPERRDSHEHSNEAKAFHDFIINSGGYNQMPNGMPNNQAMNPMGPQMGPQENNTMPPQPGPFYNPNAPVPMPPSTPQTPNSSMMMPNQYNRFQRPMRAGSNDFTGANNVPPMGMEGGRVLPGMQRLTPPGARMQGAPNQVPPSAMSQMASFNSANSAGQQPGGQVQGGQPPGQVPPQQQQQPGGPVPGAPQQQGPPQMRAPPPQQGPPQSQLGPPQMPPNNAAMSPMPMSMANAQSRWPGGPPSVAPPQMNYSSPSPVPYAPHGPGTPIMQSPQEANNEVGYGMMKGMPGNMGYHEPNMSHMVPMNSEMHHQQQMNGEMMDCMKSSPIGNMSANSRGQEDLSNTAPMNDMSQYGHFGEGSAQADSDAILKLKESMQQVAKRYEKTNEQQNEYQ